MSAPTLLPTDVLVVGGGPAGSIAAALLARRGLSVTVLDRAQRRPALGSSLVPGMCPLLDELGVGEVVQSLPHTRRWEGVTFLAEDGQVSAHFPFTEALAPALPHGFFVDREEFDTALLNLARREGAEVLSGWWAGTPVWDGVRLAGVVASNPQHLERQILARAILDASGRDAYLASRMGWRFGYPRHRKVAVQQKRQHARQLGGKSLGSMTLVPVPTGWFWLTPLAQNAALVGTVQDQAAVIASPPTAEALLDAAARVAAVAHLLAEAGEPAAATVQRDFSYRVLRLAGDGYCLIGDAGGFFDPVGSLGVLIAAATSASAAQDITEAFARHGRVDSADFGPTVALTRQLHRLAFALAVAWHTPRTVPLLLDPPRALGLRAGFISLLAGDLLREGLWKRSGRLRLLRLLSRLPRTGRPGADGVPPSPFPPIRGGLR